MSTYAYQAVDASGGAVEGTMDVASQSEALRRIKEMGFFPTRIAERDRRPPKAARRTAALPLPRKVAFPIPRVGSGVKPVILTTFTRQLATLVEAGMPLLRGLRILHQQEGNKTFKRILAELGTNIESGDSLSEALAVHPKVFNSLYLNMVKAGEIGGALDVTLRRLAEFMEKAQKIKGKVKAAMFYPVAVLFVATGILVLMTVFLIPRFQQLFEGLVPGGRMPAFTMFVLGVSQFVRHHLLFMAGLVLGLVVGLSAMRRTDWGRWAFDRMKLSLPAVGPVFRKVAISRFARTLGTLLGNGVPILQALLIVKETAANRVVGRVVASVQANVKEGETVVAPLRASGVFPPVICGMVDVGEQTGALPDLLLKIADNCDDEVDNAVNAMTSLLEPLLIIFLAIIVGGIVIALFLPIIAMMNPDATPNTPSGDA